MKLKKLLPFATIASVTCASLTSLVACGNEGGSQPIKEYEIEWVGEDSNVTLESVNKFKLNEPIVISYDLVETYDLDTTVSTITIGTEIHNLYEFSIDEAAKIITITGDKVVNKKVVVSLFTIQHQEDETFVWQVNGSSTQPDDWDLVDPVGYEEEYPSWIATDSYLSAVVENKKILAGDMAASYYSDIQETDMTNIDSITTVIGDINPNSGKCSYSMWLTPTTGHEDEYVCVEAKNFAQVVAWTVISRGSTHLYTGWANEPLVFWLASAGEGLDAALVYLQTDPTWEVTLSGGAEPTRQSVTYNNKSTQAQLETFINNYVREFSLSFKTDYWQYNDPS